LIIKVNLLPRHFAEARVVKMLSVFFVVLFVVVTASCFCVLKSKKAELQAKTAEADQKTALKADVEKISSDAAYQYDIAFSAGGYWYLLCKWVERGAVETPGEMAEIFMKCQDCFCME
jgi:hypothetical protein